MTNWARLVEEKRALRADKIPNEWRIPQELLKDVSENSDQSAFEILSQNGLLSQHERQITEKYSARDLCAELASGRLSAVDVCTAFCHRAAVAQRLVNCGTEIFFDEALERAKKLDAYLAEHGKPVGPFHGLPISVKDSFNVVGKQSTLGFVSFLAHDVASSNAPLVDILLELGAVLYIKTNVPQTMLTCDSMNNVFGRTLNPHRLSLSAGGSSGGEGALVGFHGSPLGVGTDIGGSIRVPALCGGTFGFKPTANRIPFGGQASPIREGFPGMLPAAGPLCHTAADLTFFTREVILSKPWTHDSTACHVNWRHIEPPTGLKIGLYLGHPECPLTAHVRQALEASAAVLREAGHQIIPIDDFPSPLTAMRIASEYLALDNKQTPFRIMEAGGEKPIKALSYMGYEEMVAAGPRDLDDVWRLNAELDSFREEVFQRWRSAKVDVLLCPVAQHNAVPHDTFGKPVYTLIWNLLDFPAAVVPLRNDRAGSSAADLDSLAGKAPGSVQVVGWRFEDEEVLAATEAIAKVLS